MIQRALHQLGGQDRYIRDFGLIIGVLVWDNTERWERYRRPTSPFGVANREFDSLDLIHFH